MALMARQKSSQLNDLLEDIGVSENLRLLSRNTAIVYELMLTISGIVNKNSGFMIVSGSRYEGSFIPGIKPDMDIIVIFCDKILNAHEVNQSLIVVQDEYLYPGYVKLQLSLDGQPQTIFNNHSFKPNKQYEFDCMGRICYKGFQLENMTGPAIPIIDESQTHWLDIVYSEFSKHIPNFAQEFFCRKRRYGWPTNGQVKEMLNMGCLYVYVGHEWSAEAVEWRISFTRQERMLMTSLNPIQYKVYVLLKIIKDRVILHNLNAKVLTSYHCKTCILYMAENTPQKLWNVENFEGCLIACLNTLYWWVNNNFCPSFFMKDQNLFAKTVFRRNRHKLAQTLKELIELDYKIFDLLYKEIKGLILTHTDTVFRHEIIQANSILVLIRLFAKDKTFCAMLNRDINGVLPSRLVKHLQRTDCVALHTAEELHRAVSLCSSYIYFYLGRVILIESLTKTTESSRENHIGQAYYYLSMATHTGQVSVRLFLAAFLFRMRNYEMCSDILRSVESDLEQSIYVCICFWKSFHTDMANSLMPGYCRQPIDIIMSNMEMCIEFFPYEWETTPLALQLEMLRDKGLDPRLTGYRYEEWFKNAVVDPYSFLHFMQYLVGLELNSCVQRKTALSNLCTLAKVGGPAFHRETTYNLLGWAYIQEGQLGTAMQCFIESWRIRPGYNAAKLHVETIIDTLYSLICKLRPT